MMKRWMAALLALMLLAASPLSFAERPGPTLSIDDEAAVSAGWDSISGRTEPGARVTLDVDSAHVETTADEDGAFTFLRKDSLDLLSSLEGKTMTITAYDAMGNPGMSWEKSFDEAEYPCGLSIINIGNDGSVADELRLKGWFAGVDPMDVTAGLTSGAGRDLGTIRLKTTEMTDDEKAAWLGDRAAGYGNTCYSFSAEYDLVNVPSGECTLTLRYYDFFNDSDITLVSTTFTAVRSAGGCATLLAAEDIALDIDPVERSFPSDGIVLTGWVYQTDDISDFTDVRMVTITSETGDMSPIEIDFWDEGDDKSDNPAAIADGKGVAFVDRDVVKTVDAAVRAKLTGVGTPSTHRAGFLLNLGALSPQLPGGEYTVEIVFNGGKDYRELDISPIHVTVDHTAARVTSGEVSRWVNDWKPVVIVPEETQESNGTNG